MKMNIIVCLYSLSLGTLCILRIDDELAELQLVAAPLVQAELQARLVEVGGGGGRLDGELLSRASPQRDQGPGLLLVPRPAIGSGLLQISRLAAHINIVGV